MSALAQNARQNAVYDDYVAGRLSPAKHGLFKAFLERNPHAANDVAFEESVAGDLLQEMSETDMSDGFFDKVAAALSDAPTTEPESRDIRLEDTFGDIKWRTRLPGISTHDIIGGRQQNGDRLYLLKVKPGFTIWDHSHNGDEWVLVLKGNYVSGGETFKAGALHIEDEDSMHSLTAGAEEDCICLVMTQGPVKMKSTLGKILAPIVGL